MLRGRKERASKQSYAVGIFSGAAWTLTSAVHRHDGSLDEPKVRDEMSVHVCKLNRKEAPQQNS